MGNPHEEATKKHVVEDEDDELDWDQAQSVVERMKVNENGHGERRLYAGIFWCGFSSFGCNEHRELRLDCVLKLLELIFGRPTLNSVAQRT